MKVKVDKKPNCLVDVNVEISPDRVNSEWDRILAEFQSMAKLPGFRPGKAPKNVVERKFRKDIHDEMTRALINEGIKNAVSENSLAVLSVSKVDDIEIDDDRRMTFSTTIITSPEFNLPEYKRLEVSVPPATVADEEVDEALERLRTQHADYNEIEGRSAQLEDYAVIDYSATVDGEPLDTVAPEAAKFFASNYDFWLRLVDDAFLPGFCQEILGMLPAESKDFDISVPDDFPREDLRGLNLRYNVVLKSLREQVLPEINDEFAAKVVEDKSLAELRDLILEDIKHQKVRQQEEFTRRSLIDKLLSSIEFELPDSFVKDETRRMLEEMVEDNRRRGVSEEDLVSHKDELIQSSEKHARNRLRSRFILIKVAREESLEVTEQDLAQKLALMAQQYRMPPDQLRKELEKNDALGSIREDLLVSKALDFIAASANIKEDESLLQRADDHEDAH